MSTRQVQGPYQGDLVFLSKKWKVCKRASFKKPKVNTYVDEKTTQNLYRFLCLACFISSFFPSMYSYIILFLQLNNRLLLLLLLLLWKAHLSMSSHYAVVFLTHNTTQKSALAQTELILRTYKRHSYSFECGRICKAIFFSPPCLITVPA